MSKFALLFTLGCLAVQMVGCNYPATRTTSPESSPKPPATAQVSSSPIPAVSRLATTPSQGATRQPATPTPPLTPSITTTSGASTPLAAGRDCNHAVPGNPIDITVPDNTTMEPGQSFIKTWRLVNASSCTWTSDYAAVWFSGETFNTPKTSYLPAKVPPGKSVDISMDMVAPKQPGTYQSNWKLANPSGELFGIGPNGDGPFWVRISVAQTKQAIVDNPSIPTISPQIYASGIANLTVYDTLDLDHTKINQGGTDDIQYQQDNRKQLQLATINGAQLAQAGKGQPSMADCESAPLSADLQPVDEQSSGMYYCYKTNLGLPGWMRLVYLNPKDNVLTIEILTWSIP